ncbi:unnamed protein product [Polarella glacialis]|uniref:Ubiquitin-like domain-containing protein n=1 Tax=Polarella glacialis TaxID=89957 RepID=A0A813LKB5_POLGL|nr:unnamed protein product [Polarella glacialis]
MVAAARAGARAQQLLDDEDIDVCVTTLSGQVTALLRLSRGTQVAILRGRVQEASGVPAEEQRLLHGDRVLNNNDNSNNIESPTLLRELVEPGCSSLQLTLVRVLRPWALSGGSDGELRLWDLTDGHCFRVLCGHAPVRCVAVDWTARIALSGSSDLVLRLWDLERGACLRELRSECSPRCVSMDWPSRLAVSGCSGSGGVRKSAPLMLWDLATGRCIQGLAAGSAAGPVSCLEADWRRQRVLCGFASGQLQLWDLEAGFCLSELLALPPLHSLIVDWDEQLALSGGSRQACGQLWDLTHGQFLKELPGQGVVERLAMDCSQQRGLSVASGDASAALRLVAWHLGDGTCTQEVEIDLTGPARCVALDLSRDRGLCAIASADEDIQDTLGLIDLASGRCLLELKGHSGHVACAVMT